jgi:hypothetical protein
MYCGVPAEHTKNCSTPGGALVGNAASQPAPAPEPTPTVFRLAYQADHDQLRLIAAHRSRVQRPAPQKPGPTPSLVIIALPRDSPKPCAIQDQTSSLSNGLRTAMPPRLRTCV